MQGCCFTRLGDTLGSQMVHGPGTSKENNYFGVNERVQGFFFIPTMWEATFQKSRERQPDLDGRPEIWWMPTATSAAEFPLDMQQTASPRSNLLQENPALPGMQRCLERNKLTKQL
jgi:hypothetical protein